MPKYGRRVPALEEIQRLQVETLVGRWIRARRSTAVLPGFGCTLGPSDRLVKLLSEGDVAWIVRTARSPSAVALKRSSADAEKRLFRLMTCYPDEAPRCWTWAREQHFTARGSAKSRATEAIKLLQLRQDETFEPWSADEAAAQCERLFGRRPGGWLTAVTDAIKELRRSSDKGRIDNRLSPVAGSPNGRPPIAMSADERPLHRRRKRPSRRSPATQAERRHGADRSP